MWYYNFIINNYNCNIFIIIFFKMINIYYYKNYLFLYLFIYITHYFLNTWCLPEWSWCCCKCCFVTFVHQDLMSNGAATQQSWCHGVYCVDSVWICVVVTVVHLYIKHFDVETHLHPSVSISSCLIPTSVCLTAGERKFKASLSADAMTGITPESSVIPAAPATLTVEPSGHTGPLLTR